LRSIWLKAHDKNIENYQNVIEGVVMQVDQKTNIGGASVRGGARDGIDVDSEVFDIQLKKIDDLFKNSSC
jgi:hypothetical protein